VSGIEVIPADWPAPRGVVALVTTRSGGASRGGFASLNLAEHVGDDPAAVADNRARLRAALDLPGEPCWLSQVHGTEVADLDRGASRIADAAVTATPGRVCAVLTADCLSVVFATAEGDRVGVAHAGWRGLLAGVLERSVAALACPAQALRVWLGPCIGPAAYEVGDEVRAVFIAADPDSAPAFAPNPRGRWQADLAWLARHRLAALGITAVYGGGLCTHAQAHRFYSHRRDGRCGRMATLVWRCAVPEIARTAGGSVELGGPHPHVVGQ
jgi:YfiH family protein